MSIFMLGKPLSRLYKVSFITQFNLAVMHGESIELSHRKYGEVTEELIVGDKTSFIAQIPFIIFSP